ncbi:MAG: penicillin-binding protein 1C [Rubellimicrobium sp.]|nr:penicillin-binding protein 1C [Rubellimicrobium sp.]
MRRRRGQERAGGGSGRQGAGARLLLALALLLWAGAAARDRLDAWIDATVLPPLAIAQSVEVLARDGTLLRAYTVADGRWRLAVTLDAVDPRYVDMLIRYEDRRFRDHGGVDWIAMARALWQAATSGRVVSGGSTLTMQVARLIEDTGTGTWEGKLRQIRVALALERRYSKDEILTIYLNRAPFGGNIEGLRAAALAWLGRPPLRLTPAEAALLVAIPQAPESRRPDRHPEAAHVARDRVLMRMVRDGILPEDEAAAALGERSPEGRRDFPMLAPHLADRLRAAAPLVPLHLTTIDAALQARIEDLARNAVAGGGERMQAAILVADHTTGEILASVGSSSYEADRRQGFVDMTEALRSPGSTLKPLIYGLAFDRGLAHPETLIADLPVDFAGYRPQNFDGIFRGDVRLREALQLSLNIPAVSLLEAMGPGQLMAALRRAGARPAIPGGGAPGLAVALGGLGLTLADLVRVFGALGHGGVAVDLRATPDPTPGFVPQRVLAETAAWQVGDILRDVPRPAGVAQAGIAWKTGTSYGHRDAWAVGYDGRHVVAVWMGRADGTPVPGAFGGELAAPVMFAAFARTAAQVTPLPPPPPATLIVAADRLPPPLRRFQTPGQAAAGSSAGPAIAFPPDGSVVEGTRIIARVRDGVPPFTWLANGRPVAHSRDREVALPDLGRGFSSLTVIDSTGQSARAEVELR